MELMSSLLLFALTVLPQTLGKTKGKFSYDIGSNHSTSGKHKTNQNIVFNNLPLGTKVSDLQSVFTDSSCKNCINCMERAIKAHRVPNNVIDVKTTDEIQDNTNEMRRDKRNTDENKTTIKKSRSKRNKLITVFKYVGKSDDVYAIKVKESSINSDTNMTRLETKCEVYKVQQSYPCETPEASLVLKGPKIIKKSKKEQVKNDIHVEVTSNKAVTSQFKKRQVDDSQTPENFMSSVEENMY